MKEILVSFSIKDKSLKKELIKDYAENTETINFKDTGINKPFKRRLWRKKCREAIESCDAVLVLFSKNTFESKGVRWEIRCANQHKKPIIAFKIHTSINEYSLPEIRKFNIKTSEWSNENINNYIDNL